MLKTRVITALIGFIIAVFAITTGGNIYDGLIILLALIGWREFVTMMANNKIHPPVLGGYVLAIIILAAIAMHAFSIAITVTLMSIFLGGLLYILKPKSYTISDIAHALWGLLYITIGFGALLVLRQNEIYSFFSIPVVSTNMGELVLWLLLFCTWASDTFAYFSGRAWGKHKIVPLISPNKTLEGFVGGFIGSIITGTILGLIFNFPIHIGFSIGILAGIFAPLGDLMESKLKRDCHVKDSGVLLPGHGGVLDRFDSLLFTAPLTVIYLFFV